MELTGSLSTDRIILFNNGEVAVTKYPQNYQLVPLEGTYARVLHDYEIDCEYWYGKSPVRVVGAPTPETCHMWSIPSDFYQLSRQWQMLWYRLIEYCSHNSMTIAQLVTEWGEATAERKALTDNHSRGHEYTDHIYPMFLDSDKNIFQKGLLMGGNMVKMLTNYGEYRKIEVLDVTGPAPTLEWLLEKPWLWGWATEITSVKLPNRTYKVSRWPMLKKEGRKYGTPYLHIGVNSLSEPFLAWNTVHRSRIGYLTNNTTFSPYNPPTA